MPPARGRLERCHWQKAGLRGATGKGQAFEVPPAGARFWIEPPTRGRLWKGPPAWDGPREVPQTISGLWKVLPAEG